MNGNSSTKTRDEHYSILGSDQVSSEHILTNLTHVKQEPEIIKLELEDFLTSGHHGLLPVVKATFTCDEREWRRIRFFDTVKASDFAWWQGLKTMIMREYEDTIPDHLLEFLTVETQLHVPGQDATPEVLLPLLKQIPQDEDVIHLTFGGALEGVDPEHVPEELDHCLQGGDGHLEELGITIDLICGWQDEEAEEDTEWLDMCSSCRQVLKEHKKRLAAAPPSSETTEADAAMRPPALSRNKSAPVRGLGRDAPSGRGTPVRMPSRRMQRGVSRDEVEQHNNSDPGGLLDENDESANADTAPKSRGVPRMPSRGVRALSRAAPERTKSLGVMPSRSSSAADRLALLGAGGSKRVSRLVSDGGRSLPERSASGRRTPTRTSSRKVPEAGETGRSLPARTNSRRGPPTRTSSRRVSRREVSDDEDN